MPRETVEQRLGRAAQRRSTSADTILETYTAARGKEIAVVYDEDRVSAVSTSSPYYRTTGGIGVGTNVPGSHTRLKVAWSECSGAYRLGSGRTGIDTLFNIYSRRPTGRIDAVVIRRRELAGRPVAATPSRPAGSRVLELSGSLKESTFATILRKLSGPTVVRAKRGSSLTVQGDVVVSRPGVVLERMRVTGCVTFAVGATGSGLGVGAQVLCFHIVGAKGVRVDGAVVDGEGKVAQSWIRDDPAGQPASGWRICNSTFRNFYLADDPAAHTEALFIGGGSNDGIVEDNDFDYNGTTGHIFFSWFGGMNDPALSWPHDICVRRNRFTRSLNPYYSIQARTEIPESSRISVDASNRSDVAVSSRFTRPCTLRG